ncbi:phage capsid protein, partial [Pseudoalteromonas sp. S1731]
ALGELRDMFVKVLKAHAGDTTDADDEPEGDEGKYSQLL